MKIPILPVQNFFLYLYFFLLNFESLTYKGVFSISKFSAILYLVFILPSFKTFFKIDKKLFYFLWPLFFFVIILFLNSIININNFSSKVFDIAVLLNIILFIAIINHARKDNLVLDKAIFFFMIGSIVLSILISFDIGTSINSDGRTTVFGSNLNELGVKISSSLIILLTVVFYNFLNLKKVRFLLLFSIPVLFNAILNTGSRSALAVILFAVILVFFMRMSDNKKMISSFFTSIVTLVFLLIPFIYFTLQSDLMSERILESSNDSQFGGRELLWVGFISIALSNLFFGIGFSGFANESYKYFGFVESPHNVILEIILYTGLFGLLFYVIFIYRIFYKSYLIGKHQKVILPALLISPILAYILANQALPVKFCWALLSYLTGTILVNSYKNSNQ